MRDAIIVAAWVLVPIFGFFVVPIVWVGISQTHQSIVAVGNECDGWYAKSETNGDLLRCEDGKWELAGECSNWSMAIDQRVDEARACYCHRNHWECVPPELPGTPQPKGETP